MCCISMKSIGRTWRNTKPRSRDSNKLPDCCCAREETNHAELSKCIRPGACGQSGAHRNAWRPVVALHTAQEHRSARANQFPRDEPKLSERIGKPNHDA